MKTKNIVLLFGLGLASTILESNFSPQRFSCVTRFTGKLQKTPFTKMQAYLQKQFCTDLDGLKTLLNDPSKIKRIYDAGMRPNASVQDKKKLHGLLKFTTVGLETIEKSTAQETDQIKHNSTENSYGRHARQPYHHPHWGRKGQYLSAKKRLNLFKYLH